MLSSLQKYKYNDNNTATPLRQNLVEFVQFAPNSKKYNKMNTIIDNVLTV